MATRKEASLDGLSSCSCGRSTRREESGVGVLVAADAVGAGPDEMVLIAAGSSARQTALTDKRPVDAVIMAIVDTWEVNGEVKYRK